MKKYITLAFVLSMLCIQGDGIAAEKLKRVIDMEVAGQKAAGNSQKSVERLDDESRKMLEEYRLLSQQLQRTTLANDDLQSQVERQSAEIQRISDELQEIDRMRSEIDPLMQQMLETLAELVARDTPFLSEERETRVASLQVANENRSLEISERFRQLLEAYQIEADYGRNIEAYQAQLVTESNQQKMVDFLRLGRVALFYQTLDGKTGGVWDNQKRSWIPLDSSHMTELTRAIRIARKQLPPDLMVLPMLIPEEVGQ
jgi:archaellum component FlaC